MKYYKEFLITAEPFNPEILSSILWQLDITGVNEEVNCLKIFTGENSTLTVDEIKFQLEKLVTNRLLFNFNVEENVLQDKNWNEEWEKSVNVIEVSEKIVIKPTFREYETKPGQIIIIIDPKMSFGTGEHQTTKLVLLLLEKYCKPEAKVLDVGTGTGVLAIAALKLGAASAVAIDNDEWCYSNGKENCELNEIGNEMDVRLSEIKDVNEKDFDIILANIQKNILLLISNDIKSRIKKGGILILSGLLVADESDIRNSYESLGFEYIETKIMEEWIAIVFKTK